MREELIQFETAKLAKEKDFVIYTKTMFDHQGETQSCDEIEFNYWVKEKGYCAIPSQSLLQRWLREVHNTDVYCIPWIYENKRVYDFFINYEGESRAYSSYEEAFEKGLQEALKLIKNE